MLWQGRDSLQRLRIARPPPVDLELEAVELPPLTNETEGALRERAGEDLEGVNGDRRAVLRIPGVEVRRPCSR
jgi:hypothetical protein